MTSYEWVMIAAIMVAPLLAVQATKAIEAARQKHARRLHLFHALMATRAARASPEHVQALNMIDLEFYGSRILGVRLQSTRQKAVVDAWREYRDHLNNLPGRRPPTDDATNETVKDLGEVRLEAWNVKGQALFVNLLQSLSRCLDYDFDRVELEKGAYSPEAHELQALAQLALRNWVLGLIDGTQSVPIRVSVPELEAHEVRALRQALVDVLGRCDRVGLEVAPAPSVTKPGGSTGVSVSRG